MSQPQHEHTRAGGGPAFLAGGGEAGALVRAFDWSSSPVGAPDAWPASLKTTVGTILHSRHPMFLWWGPDLIQFYNDAYTPSFGKGKHPAAMGQRGADCWQEIWPIIWPQINDVMTLGQPSWNEDHLVPIFRNGRLEEVYWTYGYSPVFDDEGGIGGTLVVCTETTSRVLASRRLQTLRALAEATAVATTAREVMEAAATVFAQAAADVVFALVYEGGPPGAAPALVKAIGVPASPAELDRIIGPQVEALARDGQARTLPADARIAGALWPEPASEVYAAAIGPAAHPTGGIVVFGLSPRLPFDAAYREYLQQLCDQVAQALSRIEAFHIRAVVESERNNLLEQAPVATALLAGPRHVFRLANPLYLRIVGRRDIVGQAYLEAFPELTGTPVAAVLDRVYQTGEPFMTEEMLIPLDRSGTGTLEDCYFKFNLEPMRTPAGRVYGMMAVAVDITVQVQARKELEKAHAEREQLVRQLEKASRAKDEFLAMLGHELRNPLSPILTALQLMQLRGVQGADRERAILERQVRHVVGLVDDLLDVSRITRGRLTLKRERVPLADVVARAIEQVSPLIEQRLHRLRVRMPDDLAVDGDRGRLAQVVTNVLTNAAKYTEPGGVIDVEAARDGEAIRLHVRDTGGGVSPEMLPHVFDAFAQERQRSDRSQGGLGLGLAIVKSLVESHGGEVALYSEGPGRGAECVIRLPAARAEADAVESRPKTEPTLDPRGRHVLLVDDNEDAAEMLADGLRGLGHRVEFVSDGPAALELAGRGAPDITLLDLGLPVMDGYELASRLRQMDGWADVPLVAVTGYGRAPDRERTEAAGFAAHLVKPVDLSEVDATVRRIGGRARRADTARDGDA